MFVHLLRIKLYSSLSFETSPLETAHGHSFSCAILTAVAEPSREMVPAGEATEELYRWTVRQMDGWRWDPLVREYDTSLCWRANYTA